MNVKAAAFPGGKINGYNVGEGASVADVLQAAKLDPKGREVRLNGQKITDLSTKVADGNQVLVLGQIRGN